MYIHNLNPILVDFGFIAIRWYSLAYIFGILIGWWIGKKILFFKTTSKKLTNNIEFDDLISYVIIGIIIGGRLGYVLFYNFSFYLKNPSNIFMIWEGGMSFHGALIGVVCATYYFSKIKKIETLLLLDIIACVAPIGLFLGRIANFINAELYGKPSELFWSVTFPSVDNISRHPSQIYESLLEGVLLFLILIYIIYKKNYPTGVCAFLFLILYGLFRIISEQFREPDLQIGYIFGSISMGSLLSAIMVFCGFVLLIKVKQNDFKQ